MNEVPLVDVVMCTNRLSPYLDAALTSLRAQTYPNWRLILADDGSECGEELQRLVANLCDVVVVHLPASGPATARNAAISAGNGEVVTFLDDDDVWPVHRLAQAVRALEDRPDSIGVFGDGVEIDANGRTQGSWRSPAATSQQFLDGSAPLPRITTLSLRRSAIEAFGLFADGMFFAEDTELTLRMVRHGELVSTGSPMVEYRRHSSNATRVGWRVLWRAGREAIELNTRAAHEEGRIDHVRLLRANRTRFDRYSASVGLTSALGHLRARRLRAGVADLWSSAGVSPVGLLHAFVARTVSRRAGPSVYNAGRPR